MSAGEIESVRLKAYRSGDWDVYRVASVALGYSRTLMSSPPSLGERADALAQLSRMVQP